jgi:hypothetical protein
VPVGCGGYQREVEDVSGAETGGGWAAVHQRDVQLARGERLELRAGQPLPQVDGQVRVVLVQPEQGGGEHPLPGHLVVADVDGAVPAGDDVAGDLRGACSLLDQSLGLGAEGQAGGGQPHVVGGAGDELHPDLALQPLELLADRGLGQVQPRRRAAEVLLLGDREERRQLPELHSSTLSGAGVRRKNSWCGADVAG